MTIVESTRTQQHRESTDDLQGGSTVVFRGLSKHFGRIVAVDDVNLTIPGGEFLTVLGPSGSGKTTVLRMLAGFETPSTGTIELDGEDVAWMPPATRDIGMVFQHYALFPHMTVGENVGYGLKMRGWAKARQRERIGEMLRLVRLEGFEDRQPRQLSGGQQQRVALARALAFGPRVLLMDEPLGALDKALRVEMGEEIRRIHRQTQTTVIYVTHDQEEALALSDRVAILRDGQLVACDSPEMLYRKPPSTFVATFFGGCNLFPARYRTVNDHIAQIECLGDSVVVPPFEGRKDEEGTLAIHPQNLRIHREADSSAESLQLTASVREVLFMGHTTQVTCDVHDHGRVIIREDAPWVSGLQPEETVQLRISSEHLVFLPEPYGQR